MKSLVWHVSPFYPTEPEPPKKKEKKLTEAERTKILSSFVDNDKKVVQKITKLRDLHKYIIINP